MNPKKKPRPTKKRHAEREEIVLGLLAKQREQRSPRKRYLTLDELERRVGLRPRA